MATGMAIMGFGGGAMIVAPLIAFFAHLKVRPVDAKHHVENTHPQIKPISGSNDV